MILFPEYVTPSSSKHEFRRQIACPRVVSTGCLLGDLISRTRLADTHIMRHDSLRRLSIETREWEEKNTENYDG